MRPDHATRLLHVIDRVTTRRTSLVALLTTALIASTPPFDAAARKKRRKNRKKRCKGSTTKCGKQCADLATNAANCGACGQACPSGECVNGACTCAVPGDCVADCFCKGNVEGVALCGGGLTQDPCQTDDDCPLGSYCFGAGNVCTVPCGG